MPICETALAALVSSRICHDLISPIGAINNGLELMTLGGTQSGPEMRLINESVNNASARVRFLRVAFGVAGEHAMGTPEVNKILGDLYAEGRISMDWQSDAAQSRSEVRLSFLAVLCIESALPYGGRITINNTDDNIWEVTGKATRICAIDAVWAMLESPDQAADLMPSHVQFAMLPAIAKKEGRLLKSQVEETFVKISF